MSRRIAWQLASSTEKNMQHVVCNLSIYNIQNALHNMYICCQCQIKAHRGPQQGVAEPSVTFIHMTKL